MITENGFIGLLFTQPAAAAEESYAVFAPPPASYLAQRGFGEAPGQQFYRFWIGPHDEYQRIVSE